MAFTLTGTPATLVAPTGTYAASLTYAGNTGAVTWTATGLPEGLLYFDNGAGTLSIASDGTTMVSGTYAITIKGVDTAAATATKSFNLFIGTAPTIDVSGIGNGVVGLKYAGKAVITGGVPGGSFSIAAGSLPTNVTITTASGVLSGTPSAAQTRTGIQLKFTDPGGQTVTSAAFSITISASGSIAIDLVDSLAAGNTLQATEGVPASLQFVAGGGSGTGYTWTLFSGTLPTGLSLTAGTGFISGSAASGTAGTYPITIKVTDSLGNSATCSTTIALKNALVLPTPRSLTLNAGDLYSSTFLATSGSTPYTYSVTSAPPGISMNSSTGVLSGSPSASGDYYVLAKAVDHVSRSVTATSFRLRVAAARRWARKITRK